MAAEGKGPGWVKVHLTLSEEPFEVHESELPGLRAQGLLAEDKPPAPPAQQLPPAGQSVPVPPSAAA